MAIGHAPQAHAPHSMLAVEYIWHGVLLAVLSVHVVQPESVGFNAHVHVEQGLRRGLLSREGSVKKYKAALSEKMQLQSCACVTVCVCLCAALFVRSGDQGQAGVDGGEGGSGARQGSG